MSRTQLLTSEGLRADGRRCHELRAVKIEFGVHSNCDGSAFFSIGNTEVMAVVSGPFESTKKSTRDEGLVSCDFRMGPFATTERSVWKKASRNTRRIEQLVSRVFNETVLTSLLPRSEVRIAIQVIQNAGNLESACINAASLALIDAGIPLKDFIVACTAGLLDSSVAVDLNQFESGGNTCEVFLAIQPVSQAIVGLDLKSSLPQQILEPLMELATDACLSLHDLMKEYVERRCEQILYP